MELNKGEEIEEILRDYFLNHNYFVIRGLPYKYQQFDVTDVDLWLYSKSSSITRERINVDIKYKRTPQVFERIFWTKGLQQVLGLDKCIVATTDNRIDVRHFGIKNDVIVLDGNLLKSLKQSGRFFKDRLNEEDILSVLEQESAGKIGGDWKGKFLASKTRVLNKLDFDGCNEFLNEIKYLMEQLIARNPNNQGVLRLFYITISLFLINVDYIVKDYIYIDTHSRIKNLIDGFRYGQGGKNKTQEIMNAAIKLTSSIIENSSVPTSLRNEINKQTNNIQAEILSEFFSKIPNINSLVDNAKAFESHGYSKEITYPSLLPPHQQSIIGLISDFHRIDRKLILSL